MTTGTHRVATVAFLVGMLAACTTEATQESTASATAEAPQPPAALDGAEPWQVFEIYTHCGINRVPVEFEGEFWEAIGPGPLSDGAGNPPPGFGNPSDTGWIARTGQDTASYQSSGGVPLFLRRLDQPPEADICI